MGKIVTLSTSRAGVRLGIRLWEITRNGVAVGLVGHGTTLAWSGMRTAQRTGWHAWSGKAGPSGFPNCFSTYKAAVFALARDPAMVLNDGPDAGTVVRIEREGTFLVGRRDVWRRVNRDEIDPLTLARLERGAKLPPYAWQGYDFEVTVR